MYFRKMKTGGGLVRLSKKEVRFIEVAYETTCKPHLSLSIEAPFSVPPPKERNIIRALQMQGFFIFNTNIGRKNMFHTGVLHFCWHIAQS